MIRNQVPFSVLLSTYYKENPEYLKAALESIWDNQTLKPDEIVIVKDGPLTKELDFIIDSFCKKAPVNIVTLEKNMGLGIALSKGVEACSNDIIARMDSDDISFPDRFEKQIPLMQKNFDVVSAWVIFFENSIRDNTLTKKIPEKHEEIIKLAKKRCPVSHACSIIRKSKVLEAGNYRHYPLYEDYDLWVRMILNNAKFYGLQDFIYWVRIYDAQFERRGGFNYLKTELKAHYEFKRIGFLNFYEFIRNIMVRVFVRLIPSGFRRLIYMFFWKKLMQ